MPRGLEPGERFGEYEILEIAGQGGMGIVYRARQVTLERTVALKVISPDVADAPDFAARFERESRLAASIDHPHVVSIFSAGELEGRAYIAMQWVDGTSLDALLGGGALDESRARKLTAQLAAALDVAHAAGLVHRDIKPPNVLVRSITGSDHAYLTDFGIARRVDLGATGLTRTGQTVGTIGYMAPEQIRGERSDGRADLYSLGCVLYQCLTGVRPFERETDVAVMFAHVNDPRPAPSAVRPELAPYDGIVARALALDPAERFQTGAELVAVLDSAAAGGETVAAPVPAGGETRTAITAELAGDPPPPPPVPPAAGPPSGGSGTHKKLAIALGSIAALTVVAVGALLATGTIGGDGEPDAPVTVVGDDPTTTQTGTDTTATTTTDDPPEPSGPSRSQDVAAIQTTLDGYERAFTNQDLSAMGTLLTADVTRRGLAAGGCTTTSGKRQVLDTYEQQFALDPGAYTLIDKSKVAIDINGDSASIDTGYTLASGASGSISFGLERSGDGPDWRISRVFASC